MQIWCSMVSIPVFQTGGGGSNPLICSTLDFFIAPWPVFNAIKTFVVEPVIFLFFVICGINRCNQYVRIAQLVEQWAFNPLVRGSSPRARTNL